MRVAPALVLWTLFGCDHEASRAPGEPIPLPEVGQKVDDPTAIAGFCGTQRFSIDGVRQPPNIMLTLDRSGSMAEMIGNVSKWDALKHSVDKLMADHGGDARWGLTLFSKPASMSCTPGIIEFSLGTSAAAVQARVDIIRSFDDQTKGDANMSFSDPNILGKGTPTPETVKVVADNGKLDDASRPNVMLLMTDGIPNCMQNPEEATTRLIEQLYARTPSVRTFVVGLGSGTNSHPDALNAWAKAGHTALPGSTSYYQADTVDQLDAAFSDITVGLVSCTYKLERVPAGGVEIFLDGVRLAADPTNGATYDSGTQSVILHGTTCESVKSKSHELKVDVLYGCDDSGGTIF